MTDDSQRAGFRPRSPFFQEPQEPDNAAFMRGLVFHLGDMEPHDRVLTLARMGPALKTRGLPENLFEADLSDDGLQRLSAVSAPPKPSPPVQPKSAPKPRFSEKMLQGMAVTDEVDHLPAGTTRRMFEIEGGGPGIVSPKGALGWPQVMPRTLRALNKRLGRELDPNDEDDAVLIHRELMQENMAHFGDPGAAVAAYNGGWDPSRWVPPNYETPHYYQYVMQAPMPEGLGMRRPKR